MPLSGATSAAGSRRWAGSWISRPIRRSIADARLREVLERLPPDVEHGVGGRERVAQRRGLLGVELLGLLAVDGAGEVEVARDAQELVGGDGRAGAAPAVGHVRLDRAEVAAAVEDHGQRLAQGQAHDAQRDRCRGVGVDQCPAEQLVGFVLVHGGPP